MNKKTMQKTHHTQPTWILQAFLAIALCLALGGMHPVTAAPPPDHTYTVDTTSDGTINSGCTDGVPDGDCSLRGAIQLANTVSSSDTYWINLPDGTYQLTLPGVDDTNTLGDLDVFGGALTIDGASQAGTIITQAGSFDRILHHKGSHSLTLKDLTIQNGYLSEPNIGGGGILSDDTGTLTLNNVRVTNNRVYGTNPWNTGGGLNIINTNVFISNGSMIDNNEACQGGGLMVNHTTSGSLTISGSVIVGNTVHDCGNGGGILVGNNAAVEITQSEISWNEAVNGAGYYQYGGTVAELTGVEVFQNYLIPLSSGAAGLQINGTATLADMDIHHNYGADGTGGIKVGYPGEFTMTESYLHHNEGEEAGGMLVDNNTSALLQHVTITYNYSINGGGISVLENGNIDLVNVTISHNEAEDYGGGLFIDSGNSSTNLDHVTIATNLGDTHGDAVYIANNGVWASKNSIFQFSIPGDVCYYDGLFIRASYGHNLWNDTSCGFSAGTDMPNTDPMLGALGYYGSDLLVRPLLPGSPAIDHALTSDPVTTDQRGKARIDGDFNGSVVSDIGAYEYYPWFFLPMLLKP